VVHVETALLQQFLNVAQRKRIAKIPPDRTKYQAGLGLPPFEDRGTGYHFAILSRHEPATPKVATHPLQLMGDTKITLIKPPKNAGGADIVSEKAGKKICFEVKALTKQSTGGSGKFFEQQLYDKVFDLIGTAKNQLMLSAAELKCDLQIVVFVVNWFSQSIYLAESDYFDIVKRLATEQDHSQLTGIDGILFVTSAGTQFLFLEEAAKSIDC
jgi:hypothetical protein